MRDFRQEFADMLTDEVRTILTELSTSPDIMAIINAPWLLILNRMKKTIKVSPTGALIFSTPEHEITWRKWQYGTSKSQPLPIDRIVTERISEAFSSYLKQ